MDLSTVSGVVEALVATYIAGLEYYTKWQQHKWQNNQYNAHTKANLCGGNACAFSTSLGFSARKIREAFDGGVDILGDGFATGDGRLVPSALPGFQQRPRLSVTVEEETTETDDDDVIAYDDVVEYSEANCGMQGTSKSSYMQSEPPSPPPTPKQSPDDAQSTYTSNLSTSRPKNSVFSIFCPEALKYQVNPRKAMPKQRNCRCGYDWNGIPREISLRWRVRVCIMYLNREDGDVL
ncbi:hypothetical protein ABKA04_008247 [Annulohypoxylon sp. FPYF3050]